MLKLTAYPQGVIYVRASSISGMSRLTALTTIRSDGFTFDVLETPEEILGMREMLYDLFPPMALNYGTALK